MAPRPRDRKRRGLPENLYEHNGYYTWRDPSTDKRYGLGKDRRAACAQAVEANLHIAGQLAEARLIDRLTGEGDRTLSAWCNRYLKILDDRDIAKATRQSQGRRIAVIREKLGSSVLSRITTLDVAEFLKTWDDAGKKRSVQAIRSLMLDMFREAIAAGWTESNPVQVTRAARVQVKRARLTLEVFKAIYAYAQEHQPPWVARSMELALVTAQRREDVRELAFKDVRNERLWVVQRKTGARVCIPLDLRLNAMDFSVREVIQRCRDNVVSAYMVHHASHNGRAKPGDRIRAHTIAGAFAEARDAVFPDAAATWPGKTPPSLHEIRSLAARLYTEQGVDAQALLGHKSPDMTAIYRDVRGAEWIEVDTAGANGTE